MHQPRNPFILGHRIQRPYFCDRFSEQSRLYAAVTNGRNVVLISPRRMGKTSLAWLTLHDSPELERDYYTFFIDILQTNSLGEFTFLLGKSIFNALSSRNEARIKGFIASLKSLRGSFGFDPLSGTPTFNVQLGDIKNPEYTLEEIFGYIEQSDKPILIVIDEFQQITHYPEKNVEALLRSHIQQSTKATFIFAGSEQTVLSEMFSSAKRPFYNSSEIMHLDPIDEKVYTAFTQEMFSLYGKSIDGEPISRVFNLFDGNTFYLQRTMNGAFAETAEGGKCSADTIEKVLREMIASNDTIFREILSNLPISQKKTLYAIAQEKKVTNPMGGAFVKKHALQSASSVQSALQKLTKIGLINKSSDGYQVADPLLRIFINSLYSTPEL